MSNIAAACGIVTSPPLFSHFGWNGLRVKREASMKFAAWRRNDPNLMISQMSKPCKCLQIRAAAGTKPANASSSLEVLKKIDLGAMAYEGMDILRFLASKSILITGCTGFVGKVLLEKILRVQPNVGRIYVLIRGKDSESVKARFRKQVLDKELFQVLRQQHGSNYENFMLHKVVPVMGDIRMNNLGIIESIREDLLDKIDIIVNSAATTSFDERYDVSMKTNTNGVINVIEFGKQCRKLKILLHVSTAYVHGERKGLIKERPLFMGDTLTHDVYSGGEIPFLDIDAECNLIETTRNKILADGSSSLWEAEKTVTWRMKELGLERARKFGWPNTYVFTKAMGEMLIAHLRGDLPVAILRPTAIESTLAEPFPGWMEGNRVFDPLILGYGKGRLSSFVGAPGLLADVVPVDTVAKAMIAAIAKHGMEPPCLSVYHIASSVANPLTYTNIYEYTYTYFSSKPYKDKEGRPVKLPKFKHLPSLQGFRQYTMLRYWLHIQILRVAGNVFGGIFKRQHKRLLSEYSYIMKLAELYEPYLLNFYARFDVSNTDHLLSMLSDEDRKMFDFNVRNFDWTDYMLNVHIPGLVKHILKR